MRCVGLWVQQHHKQQHGKSSCLTRHLSRAEVLSVHTCAPACRCDRNLTLGIPVASLQKLLKCAGNNDIITLKAEDSGEMLTLMFEDPKADRVSGVCVCVCVCGCVFWGGVQLQRRVCSCRFAGQGCSMLQCQCETGCQRSCACCGVLTTLLTHCVCPLVLRHSPPWCVDFSLKLMDIDSEHLAIPETEYSATVRMPAGGADCADPSTAAVAARRFAEP